MKLRNLDFGGWVFGQSGVQGFFGEGDEYPHHRWYKYIPGFSFKGMSFVAKTVTLEPRIYPENSNTKLRSDYKIKDFMPPSVWWSAKSLWNGYLLNAIGLANPGLEKMLEYRRWQWRHDIFQISVSLMRETFEQKALEAKEICRLLKEYIPFGYQHLYALQINFSCPNTGHELFQAENEIIGLLKIFRRQLRDVCLIPKFDLLVAPATIKRLKKYCDAFCIANTIPFGKKEVSISWMDLFKNGVSPLVNQLKRKSAVKKDFAGGLSGAPLFPVLRSWIIDMQLFDPTVSIIAGGGIMTKQDILTLSKLEIVKGIALGSVAILRPWRVQSLIKYGNKVFTEREKHR